MYLVIITLLACLIIQNKTIQKYENNADNVNLSLWLQLSEWLNFKFINRPFLSSVQKMNKDTYIATLIHDLKTPANAQIRTLQLLLDGCFGDINEYQREILKEALYSEKYMAEIVSNILTSYKYDCGELKLKMQFFDIADTLNTIYKSLNNIAEDKHQKININYNCSNLIFYGDKLQMMRVMTNLISNAIKYGFQDSTINITLSLDTDKLDFVIENKTLPIPQEKLEHIFDKFTGGMSHYNSASTGLGLYLSKKIIEMHDGKIYAKCTPEGLCIFGFNIPVLLPAKNFSEKLYIKK